MVKSHKKSKHVRESLQMPPKDRNPTLHIKTEPKSSSLVGGLVG